MLIIKKVPLALKEKKKMFYTNIKILNLFIYLLTYLFFPPFDILFTCLEK